MNSRIYITNKNLRIFREKGEKRQRIIFHIFRDCKLLENQKSGIQERQIELNPVDLHKRKEGVMCCPECFERKWPGYALEADQQVARVVQERWIDETAQKLALISIYGPENNC